MVKKITKNKKEQVIDDYTPSEFCYGNCIFTGDPVGYVSDEIGNGLILVGSKETIYVSQKEVDTVIKLIRAYIGR